MPDKETPKILVPDEHSEEIANPAKLELPKEVKNLITINFEELKPNSVIIIKIDPEGMQQRIAATQQIAMALRPFMSKAKEKGIAFILMSDTESMDVVDEIEMNRLGWYKKEKSQILQPGKDF